MILCKASEIGKIIVNKCLSKNMKINTQKLEKLLVLSQIEYIKRTNKKLFKEDIYVWDCGVVIPEVDKDFMKYAIQFDEPQAEYILLLEEQENAINYVIDTYGNMDSFDINNLKIIQDIIALAIDYDNKKLIPLVALHGKFLYH